MDQTQGIKTIDPNQTRFEANGHVYTIAANSLSVNRWQKYLELQAEFGMGSTLPEIMAAFRAIYDAANLNKCADIGVLSRDAMIGISNIGKREPQALRLCALFCNREGEDLKTISDDLISEKIEDWKAEGFDIQGFFHLAVASLEGFRENYEAATAVTSKPEKKTTNPNRSSTTSKESMTSKT
jgi:hypothetical protein